MLLASFHGLPKRYHEKGDPYYCHCHKTARLLRDALSLDENGLQMAFQSRFGPDKWLQPYMDHEIDRLAASGIKKVAVITPGFAADCVETLEEIAIGIKEQFLGAGGTHFTIVPALNDSVEGIDLLEHLSKNVTAAWCNEE